MTSSVDKRRSGSLDELCRLASCRKIESELANCIALAVDLGLSDGMSGMERAERLMRILDRTAASARKEILSIAKDRDIEPYQGGSYEIAAAAEYLGLEDDGQLQSFLIRTRKEAVWLTEKTRTSRTELSRWRPARAGLWINLTRETVRKDKKKRELLNSFLTAAIKYAKDNPETPATPPIDVNTTSPLIAAPTQSAEARGRRARTTPMRPNEGHIIMRNLVCMVVIFLSFPLTSCILPSFTFTHILDFLDVQSPLFVSLPIASLFGAIFGAIFWVIDLKLWTEKNKHRELVKLGAWTTVWLVAVIHITARSVDYAENIQAASSIDQQIANWKPVVTDDGSFRDYQKSCIEPTLGGGIHFLNDVLVFSNSVSPNEDYGFNDAGVYINTEAYQCSMQGSVLQTSLSLNSAGLMVMYSGGEKNVRPDAYYIETELRPTEGSPLSSCVLAIAKYGLPTTFTTIFSVESIFSSGRINYFASVTKASPDGTAMANIARTGDLPFVLHDTLLDDFDGWVKLAVFKSNGTVQFLVNDRVVAAYTDKDKNFVYPQLGIRAGAQGTDSPSSSTATCQFKYFRAYTPL